MCLCCSFDYITLTQLPQNVAWMSSNHTDYLIITMTKIQLSLLGMSSLVHGIVKKLNMGGIEFIPFYFLYIFLYVALKRQATESVLTRWGTWMFVAPNWPPLMPSEPRSSSCSSVAREVTITGYSSAGCTQTATTQSSLNSSAAIVCITNLVRSACCWSCSCTLRHTLPAVS